MSANKPFLKNQNLPGVYESTKKDGTLYYRASLTYKRKHISLGSFSSAKKANRAYLEGLKILESNRKSLLSYRETSPLSYEKWVSLINFRDNDIYFGNPIYVKQRYFEYHLDRDLVLKFDMDDLFYYSSHKIMKRGGHYFVADYGMQVNILSRYEIKNYSKIGVDYKFKNNDTTDFRRENLEIFNKYQGVRMSEKKGRFIYTTRIHINGDYIVGRYKTEIEAAIAYNKAADILKKNGLNKNFATNYVESITAREYAEIYTSVAISDKVSLWGVVSN